MGHSLIGILPLVTKGLKKTFHTERKKKTKTSGVVSASAEHPRNSDCKKSKKRTLKGEKII